MFTDILQKLKNNEISQRLFISTIKNNIKFNKGYSLTCGSKECKSKSIAYGNKFNHNYENITLKMKETYAHNHNGILHNMQNPEFVKLFMKNKQNNTIKKYLTKYNYSIISIDNDYYTFKCNICGSIFSDIHRDIIHYNLYRNKLFCSKCYNNKQYTTRSKFEESVYLFILSLISEKEKIITNKKVGSQFYIYDIVLFDRNLVIECNGIYYHSDSCISDNKYHYKKLLNANCAGYDLLQIWQDDWYNNKEFIKNKIIQIINPTKIDINKCTVFNSCILYNNTVILKIILNNNIIILEYLSTFIIENLYEYIKNNYLDYYIEHNLDYPLFNFEKKLDIEQYIDVIYCIQKKKKIETLIDGLPKIYASGKILLKI